MSAAGAGSRMTRTFRSLAARAARRDTSSGISICKQQDVSVRQAGLDRPQLFLAAAQVGAVGRQDAVLAAAVDEDDAHPGCSFGIDGDAGGVDAVGAQGFEEGGAEEVVADAAHHLDAGALAGGGHRLGRPLAPGGAVETLAAQGLAGGRQGSGAGDQPHVDAAEDENAGGGGCGGHGGGRGNQSPRISPQQGEFSPHTGCPQSFTIRAYPQITGFGRALYPPGL